MAIQAACIRVHSLSYQGCRGRIRWAGNPRETLGGTTEGECAGMRVENIQELRTLAVNGQNWRFMTSALCTSFGSKRSMILMNR